MTGVAMSSVETLHRLRAPSLGRAVVRSQLIRLYMRERPGVALIHGPAAYGKSVLAAQIASSGGVPLWIPIPRGADTPASALRHAVEALQPGGGDEHYAPLCPAPTAWDLAARLDAAVRALESDDACVVLDNLQGFDRQGASELVRALADRAPGVRYVITLRSTRPALERPVGVWCAGPSDLLMSEAECADLLATILGTESKPAVVADLTQASGRQPGLLAVLAGCHAAGGGSVPSSPGRRRPNVTDTLTALAVEQLDAAEMHLLRCMALLGQGSLAELGCVAGHAVSVRDLEPIAVAVPLLSLEACGAASRFSAHELAQAAFGRPDEPDHEAFDALRRVLRVLAERGSHESVLTLAVQSERTDLLSSCLEEYGLTTLRRGGFSSVQQAVRSLSTVELLCRPSILVLRAALALEQGDNEAALRDAQVARELAEQDGRADILANAMLVLAQASLGLGDFLLARAYIDRALALCGSGAEEGAEVGLQGFRLALSAVYGDLEKFRRAKEDLRVAADRAATGYVGALPTARFFSASADIILSGSWSEAWRSLEPLGHSRLLPMGFRASAFYNAFGCALELGHLDAAAGALADYDELMANSSNEAWRIGSKTLHAILDAASGLAAPPHELFTKAANAERALGQLISSVTGLTTGSVALLGSRRPHDALLLAEQAVRFAEETAAPMLVWPARLEVASASAASGRTREAQRIASAAHEAFSASPGTHVHLRADLLLALVDMDAGRFEEATARIREHVEYILTESANWQLAMYVRAFPALLAPLCAAVGAADLPVHMLNLVLPAYAEEAFDASRAFLPQSELEVLSLRLRGRPLADAADPGAAPVCHVRVLGGLTVEVDGRIVSDKDWRKRKARLLFAMLCARNGKDVPRDQLLDYLWPDMDQDQARNNLYVVWSSMKHALTPALGRGEDCPYVENRRGVCRTVPGRVVTDLEEFERKLEEATRARSEGDDAAELVALQRASELYRGDLLPGEAYDDWFATLRERCRHDYEDAMLRAAALQEQRGDVRGALGLLRRALVHDPWREDLYQAALRLQIVAGQRSAAIETYLTCRTRLVEDLGIDPSAETTRLYEQVLGMEDGLSDYMG